MVGSCRTRERGRVCKLDGRVKSAYVRQLRWLPLILPTAGQYFVVESPSPISTSLLGGLEV